MTSAFIICGALGREVHDLRKKYGWSVDIVGINARHHLYPQRIAPDVEKQICHLREKYERLLVIFGECGTLDALDSILEKYQIERLGGEHCYAWYSGEQFQTLLDEEPGTFFLTDFLVRAFQGAVVKGLGLDRYPELKADYFGHYKRLVYFIQNPQQNLIPRAEAIASYLELPLEIRTTGYGELERQLVAWMNK